MPNITLSAPSGVSSVLGSYPVAVGTGGVAPTGHAGGPTGSVGVTGTTGPVGPVGATGAKGAP